MWLWCQCGWLFRRPRYALSQTKRFLWILIPRKSFEVTRSIIQSQCQMQWTTLYPVQISINKWHTALLSKLYVSSPQYKFWGGRVLPFTRDLCLWLVLCLTYIARNVMPTTDFNEMRVFSTYNIAFASAFYPSRPQKKSAKNICILHFWKSASPQIPRSAFYRRPGRIIHQAMGHQTVQNVSEKHAPSLSAATANTHQPSNCSNF